MKNQKPQLIDKKEIKNWLHRPIWYQSRIDVNDFGWAFIDPSSVSLAYTGEPLRFCKLIKTEKISRTLYQWDMIEIYDKPAIKRLCSRCMNWVEATPGQEAAHCAIHTMDGARRCTLAHEYADFRPEPYWEDRKYTAQTFIRQCQLANYSFGG